MSQPSDDLAPAEPIPPSPRAPGRRGILALVDRPMVVAFVATLGVLGGLVIGSGIASITTIIIYIVLALFVSLALDPIVRVLERRGMKRGAGIGIVFGAFALLAVVFFVFVLPPILSQVGSFVRNLPEAILGVVDSEWFAALPPDLPRPHPAGLVGARRTTPNPRRRGSPPGGSARMTPPG